MYQGEEKEVRLLDLGEFSEEDIAETIELIAKAPWEHSYPLPFYEWIKEYIEEDKNE